MNDMKAEYLTTFKRLLGISGTHTIMETIVITRQDKEDTLSYVRDYTNSTSTGNQITHATASLLNTQQVEISCQSSDEMRYNFISQHVHRLCLTKMSNVAYPIKMETV